jgi:hypothetical protein
MESDMHQRPIFFAGILPRILVFAEVPAQIVLGAVNALVHAFHAADASETSCLRRIMRGVISIIQYGGHPAQTELAARYHDIRATCLELNAIDFLSYITAKLLRLLRDVPDPMILQLLFHTDPYHPVRYFQLVMALLNVRPVLWPRMLLEKNLETLLARTGTDLHMRLMTRIFSAARCIRGGHFYISPFVVHIITGILTKEDYSIGERLTLAEVTDLTPIEITVSLLHEASAQLQREHSFQALSCLTTQAGKLLRHLNGYEDKDGTFWPDMYPVVSMATTLQLPIRSWMVDLLLRNAVDSHGAAAYLADNMDTTLDDETTRALIARLDTIIGVDTLS